MSDFRQQFDNYVFVDKNGHEYPAVVEQSLWQRSPSYGPFLSASLIKSETRREDEVVKENDSEGHTIGMQTGLENDQDFIEFVQKLKEPKRRSKQSPVQTLETNLDAITNSSTTSGSPNANIKDKSKRVVTPLVGYVNQKRHAKTAKKGRG